MSPPSSASPADEPALKQVERRMGRKLVSVMVLAVVVYAGLLLYGDIGAMVDSARQVSAFAVVAAMVLSTGNFAIRYLRWEYYLRRLGITLPVTESALVFVSGFSMTLTPVRAGEVLKSLMLKETRDLPVARTAPIMVAERITDLAALVLLSALGCLPFPGGLLFCAGGTIVVALLLLICAYRPLGGLLLELAGKIPPVKRLLPKMREAYETVWALTDFQPFLVGLLTGTVAWGLQCLCLYVIAGAFTEIALSLEASLFIYSAPLLAGTVAMVPGGLGLTEASMTALMLELGGPNVSYAAAAAITLIVRLVALWWAVACGFAALGIWRVRAGAAGAQTPAVR